MPNRLACFGLLLILSAAGSLPAAEPAGLSLGGRDYRAVFSRDNGALLWFGPPAATAGVFANGREGLWSVLLKDAGPALLAQAIHAAANGDALIAPNITARLLGAFAETAPGSPPPQPIEALTDREEQVLVAVARGRTNSEIADELYITLSTVKTHIASVMAKLGARNRVEIAIWAYETRRVDRSAS